jgi:hypothetical protein
MVQRTPIFMTHSIRFVEFLLSFRLTQRYAEAVRFGREPIPSTFREKGPSRIILLSLCWKQ